MVSALFVRRLFAQCNRTGPVFALAVLALVVFAIPIFEVAGASELLV